MIDIRFDEERSPRLWLEFMDLFEKNPRHFSLVASAGAMAHMLFGKPLVLTSIWRDDEKSVHHYWRGTDVRIFHPLRNTPTGYEGLEPAEAAELADLLNRTFRYKRINGPYSEVAKLHGEDMNYHMHLQSPAGEQWKV